MPREQLKTLTEQMYYLLLTLRKENFGFQMMEDISEMTHGRIQMGAGTLYALLSRFESEGLICQTREENRKKYYQITDNGLETLKEEYRRLKLMVSDGMELEDDL